MNKITKVLKQALVQPLISRLLRI